MDSCAPKYADMPWWIGVLHGRPSRGGDRAVVAAPTAKIAVLSIVNASRSYGLDLSSEDIDITELDPDEVTFICDGD